MFEKEWEAARKRIEIFLENPIARGILIFAGIALVIGIFGRLGGAL